MLALAAGVLSLAVSRQLPAEETSPKPRLMLLVSRFDEPSRDLVAMTIGSLCRQAGVEYDLYYAADHKEAGLFAPHGSSVLGGQHAARIGRALAAFQTTVVRRGGAKIFDSLLRQGAKKILDVPDNLVELYAAVAAELGIALPADAVAFAPTDIPLPVFYPECVHRKAVAVPLTLSGDDLARLKAAGVKNVWTVAGAKDSLSAWQCVFDVTPAVDLDAKDANLAVVERWIDKAQAVDPLEPRLAAYLLPWSIREDRLILSYKDRPEAERRRDQILRLTAGKGQAYVFGRWFGDREIIPMTAQGVALNVVEPCRHILTIFAKYPVALPQPVKSCFELEPSDEQLRAWAAQGKILASWVLHSGELSHDDAVLTFQDWSAMTKVRIGSGVHWQRYAFDPDAVEQMQVPVEEGGVLGVVEPVLHSLGNGIGWETAGDPQKVAALMADSRKRIAALAGDKHSPRGCYCFGDHYQQPKDGREPGPAQLALWKAIHAAGFEYVITSALAGESRVLYREGDFVVLSQAARHCDGSPFYRGFPETFAAEEKKLAADKPGWMVGALDSPIHGSPIYLGRPYGGNNPQPRLPAYYDYLQYGGASGRVISATPHTIARYARLLDDTHR
jgi:hypothetical protein